MKIQTFGLLYGSAPLTLIVMAVAAIAYGLLTYRLICAVLTALYGVACIAGIVCSLICAGFFVYCLIEIGLAAKVLCRAILS